VISDHQFAMRDYDERMEKSPRFIEIPLAIEDGGDIANRGHHDHSCECDESWDEESADEEEESEEEESEVREREEFRREHIRVYRAQADGVAHEVEPAEEATCRMADLLHDSSGESSSDPSDSDDEDFVPDSASDDESEITRPKGTGRRPPHRKTARWWREQRRAASRARRPSKKAAGYAVGDARRVAFAVIAGGIGYRQAVRFAQLISVVLPSEREFYRHVRVVADEIVKMARESIEAAYAEMVAPATCSVDATWSSRLRGTHCDLMVYCRETRKIIGLEIVELPHTGPHRTTFRGNFHGTPQGMEGEAIRRFARAEVQRPGGSRIGSIVTDGETSARRIFEELGWDVAQLADPNHLRVCLKRSFERWKFITPEGWSKRNSGWSGGWSVHALPLLRAFENGR
jgi:hypothetical protein